MLWFPTWMQSENLNRHENTDQPITLTHVTLVTPPGQVRHLFYANEASDRWICNNYKIVSLYYFLNCHKSPNKCKKNAIRFSSHFIHVWKITIDRKLGAYKLKTSNKKNNTVIKILDIFSDVCNLIFFILLLKNNIRSSLLSPALTRKKKIAKPEINNTNAFERRFFEAWHENGENRWIRQGDVKERKNS